MKSRRVALLVAATAGVMSTGCPPSGKTPEGGDPGATTLNHITQIHRLIERNKAGCNGAAAAVKSYIADNREALAGTRTALMRLHASMTEEARAKYIQETNAQAARNAKKTARTVKAFAAACPDALREISESLAFLQPGVSP